MCEHCNIRFLCAKEGVYPKGSPCTLLPWVHRSCSGRPELAFLGKMSQHRDTFQCPGKQLKP